MLLQAPALWFHLGIEMSISRLIWSLFYWLETSISQLYLILLHVYGAKLSINLCVLHLLGGVDRGESGMYSDTASLIAESDSYRLRLTVYFLYQKKV